MHKSRLAGLLLGPSLLSATIAIILAALILSVTSWSYIKPDTGLYEYLFGPYGLTTILQNSTNPLSAINGSFSSPAMYKVAVGVFALFIGLLVYVFLEGMDHITAKTSGALHEVQFISDQALRKKAEHQAEVRLGLRVTTLVVWICYLVFFGRIIVPSCILLTRPDSAPYLLAWHNIISFFAGFVILTVALHVHVICMRLLVLRPRLFGGENVVVGRGGHEE